MKPKNKNYKFILVRSGAVLTLLSLSCASAVGQEAEPLMDIYKTPLWTQLAKKPRPVENAATQPALAGHALAKPALAGHALAKPSELSSELSPDLTNPTPPAALKKKSAKPGAAQKKPTDPDFLSNPAAENDFSDPHGMAEPKVSASAEPTSHGVAGRGGPNKIARLGGAWYKNIYLRAEYGQDSFSKQKSKAADGSSIGHAFKRNPVWSGGLGYKFNEFFRADINYQSRSIDGSGDYIKGGKQTAWFLNAYGMLMDEGYLRPYLTAGIGQAKTKLKTVESGADKTTGSLNKTAWNIGIGLAVQLQEQVALTIGYKYLDFGKVTRKTTVAALAPSFGVRLRAQEVVGGVVFNL